MKAAFPKIIVALSLYLLLKYLGGTVGAVILYPVTLLVTFLHEFGHALGAILTGGSVQALQINSDGSGYTVTAGGWKAIILMGGYVGSAILGNLLFYVAVKKPNSTVFALYLLASVMVLAAIVWFNSIYTTLFLIFASYILYFVGSRRFLHQEVLMFLGIASIIYIVQDFNIGPRSDLEEYARTMLIFSPDVWMYIWLAVVVFICFINIRWILKNEQ